MASSARARSARRGEGRRAVSSACRVVTQQLLLCMEMGFLNPRVSLFFAENGARRTSPSLRGRFCREKKRLSSLLPVAGFAVWGGAGGKARRFPPCIPPFDRMADPNKPSIPDRAESVATTTLPDPPPSKEPQLPPGPNPEAGTKGGAAKDELVSRHARARSAPLRPAPRTPRAPHTPASPACSTIADSPRRGPRRAAPCCGCGAPRRASPRRAASLAPFPPARSPARPLTTPLDASGGCALSHSPPPPPTFPCLVLLCARAHLPWPLYAVAGGPRAQGAPRAGR